MGSSGAELREECGEGITTALRGVKCNLCESGCRGAYGKDPMRGAIQLRPRHFLKRKSLHTASQGGMGEVRGDGGSGQDRPYDHCLSCKSPCCCHASRAIPPGPIPPLPPKSLLQPPASSPPHCMLPAGSLLHKALCGSSNNKSDYRHRSLCVGS